MKPGQFQTRIYTQVVQLTKLGQQHQQAIEELTDKLICTATNLNMCLVRLAVTERIVKERLHLTEQDIEQAVEQAMVASREQVAVETGSVERPNSESAAMLESDQIGLPAEAEPVRPRLLKSIPASPQTQPETIESSMVH